jgi:hypothetical protein
MYACLGEGACGHGTKSFGATSAWHCLEASPEVRVALSLSFVCIISTVGNEVKTLASSDGRGMGDQPCVLTRIFLMILSSCQKFKAKYQNSKTSPYPPICHFELYPKAHRRKVILQKNSHDRSTGTGCGEETLASLKARSETRKAFRVTKGNVGEIIL